MALTIKPVITIEECRQIEDLQRKIWDMDETDVVPDHLLLTAAKNQGVVLLARLDGQPIGFVFSFQGATADGVRKPCSHQAGVFPGERSRGVGYRLKLAQRKAVLAQGIELITWTCDPLLSRNAKLNIGKLGAMSYAYFPRLYGDMRDGLNKGWDSDRLEVSWHLNSSHVQAKLHGKPAPLRVQASQILNPAARNQRGFFVPPEKSAPLSHHRHFVQIPTHIDALKKVDMALAIAWRIHIRHLLELAFAEGYTIVDFVHQPGPGSSYYVIETGVNPRTYSLTEGA